MEKRKKTRAFCYQFKCFKWYEIIGMHISSGKSLNWITSGIESEYRFNEIASKTHGSVQESYEYFYISLYYLIIRYIILLIFSKYLWNFKIYQDKYRNVAVNALSIRLPLI